MRVAVGGADSGCCNTGLYTCLPQWVRIADSVCVAVGVAGSACVAVGVADSGLVCIHVYHSGCNMHSSLLSIYIYMYKSAYRTHCGRHVYRDEKRESVAVCCRKERRDECVLHPLW